MAILMSDRTFRGARWRLAALALVMLLPSLGTSIANVALPTLAGSFAASSQEVQWVVIAYLLAVTSLIVPAGRLGDLLGRRRLMLLGIAIFAAASTIGAVAPSLWFLVASRGVQGAGAALMMALAIALVGDAVPKARTGSAMGLMGTVSAAGTALGPSLGGLLVSSLGWQSVFVVMALASIVALGVVFRTLLPDPEIRRQGPSLDLPGTILLGSSLGAYALSTTLDVGWEARAALVGAAALGLITFVAVERRAPFPLVQLQLLRHAQLSTGLVALALVSAIIMATLVVGPFYLSGTLHLGPLEMGLVMTVGPAVAAVTGVPAGHIIDRLGPPAVAFTGLAGISVASALMAMLPETFGVGGYVASLGLVTMSYALFQAANTTAVMGAAAADRKGVTSAFLALARNLGLLTGASAMGALFAWGSGDAHGLGHAANGNDGLRLTFAVATVLGGLALAVSWWGYQRRCRGAAV